MPRDKTINHIKIMAAAKEEFLERGYEKASMRSIADRCNLTAAGLYRHCRDKEDLFCQLVSPAEKKLMEWAGGHMRRYEEPVKKGKKITWQDSNIDMMRELVYPNMEDYHLLVAKSKGSKYENFLHDMTEESQNKFLSYLEEMRKTGIKTPDISPRQLHLLLTAYITALFEPVVHNYSYEEAVDSLEKLEKFFLPGWKQLMGL
ncbi:MAG: TetR/AcrR family transcriptional regulator [Oscillospiraceae bacterium]|nr:TetR/AcrR family transcriptional regulator [Oscillospiraceae bacterium]